MRRRRLSWLLLYLALTAMPALAWSPGVRPPAAALATGATPVGLPLAGQRYVVRQGDTVGTVARRFRVRALTLARYNRLGSPQAVLATGQVLLIPLPGLLQWRAAGPFQRPARLPVAEPNHMGVPKVVLADYMLWYSPTTFDGRQTFDLPVAGPYSSSDESTIRRQIGEAQQACLDGLAAHWFGPNEPVTTRNFEALLRLSARTNLQHTVVILANFWPGANEASIGAAVRYVLDRWADNANYMKLGGRPLLLFTDMSRPWGSDAAALAGWTRIREAVDPEHKSIWMAEGLNTLYNPLFDGLYVYRIDHRDYPQAWLKQPHFASQLRVVERQAPLPLGGLYFADTIAPGYDDTRAGNTPFDLRSPAPPFARDRRNGGYYADTFAVTAQTGGDFLLVKSYNEWVEGTAIEPSVTYGNLYLDLTCQYANAYRNR